MAIEMILPLENELGDGVCVMGVTVRPGEGEVSIGLTCESPMSTIWVGLKPEQVDTLAGLLAEARKQPA